VVCPRLVTPDQAIAQQPPLDCLDGAAHARVLGRKKTHQWQQQNAGIEVLRAVGAHERAKRAVEAAAAYILMYALAQTPPAPQRCLQPELLSTLYHTIQSPPGHDFRVGEVPCLAADLPDAAVGLLPDPFEVLDQCQLQ